MRPPRAVGESLHGGDPGAVVGDGEQQAAVDAPPVDQDRAGAALAVVAALLGTGQAEVFPQQVQERDAVVHVELVRPPVHLQPDAGAGLLGWMRHACPFVPEY